MEGTPTRLARRASLIYALFGGLWILTSDLILHAKVHDPETAARVSMYKGWAFVVVTAVLLFSTLRVQFTRWLAEVARREQAEADRHREATRMREYVEHAPIGVFVSDLAGRFLVVNDAAKQILGAEGVDLTQHTMIDFAPESERDAARASLATILATGQFDDEVLIRRRDGATAWMHLRAVRLADDRCLAFAYDITEHKRLEAQFLQAQKMEAVGTLAGGIAHDFNNILTVILSSAGILALPDTDAAESRELAQQIQDAAERAASLTRQLLLFSRKQAFRPVNVDLHRVVDDLARMFRRIVGEHIVFETRHAARLPPVRGDVGMIEQALMNLSVNARDAMPGGGTLSLRTSDVTLDEAGAAELPDAHPGQYAVIEVSDTGVGIPDAVMPHIFEPFFTTKEVGRGTGLGLATVYGIVKQHKGWISVRSEPGAGTTFRLGLPVTSEAVADAHAPTPQMHHGRGSVLVVEDEAAVRLGMTRALRECGYDVLEAGSGPEALRVRGAHDGPLALLVTDLVMPDHMGGVELAAALRARDPSLRVLFTSGYDAHASLPGALAPGDSFLQKPFGAPKLSEAVRRALAGPVAEPPTS